MFYFPEIKCLDIAHLKGFYNLDKEKNDKLQVMFYFPEIKCLDIAHLKGFYNLDKTLDLEFYCLKCCF